MASAAARRKQPPVGSAQWIQSEKENIDTLVREEADEFGYSVRGELEWLNSQMQDIFSTSQVDYKDLFKTPGKLGKTPRTARRINATPRQPLTDIFAPAPNAQTAPLTAQKNSFYEKIAQNQTPQDMGNYASTAKLVSGHASSQRTVKPYTDSGYHGMMTEDEMELDARTLPDSFAVSSQATSSQATEVYKIPVRDDQQPAQRVRDSRANDTGTSDDSFVSAKEQESDAPAIVDQEMVNDEGAIEREPEEDDELMEDQNVALVAQEQVRPQIAENNFEAPVFERGQDVDIDMEGGTPQSDTSSPEKPLQRKSSFTFSSLPAREPLGTKRSMGQIDRHRSSFFSKSTNKASQNDADDEFSQERPAEPRTHSKSSTQLLHERLNMLGKTKEARTSKSIPQSVLSGQPSYPQLSETEQPCSQDIEAFESVASTTDGPAVPVEDDDDDWIAPTKPAPSDSHDEKVLARPAVHQKSISTTNIPSPSKSEADLISRHQKAISVSHPVLVEALGTTTPAGSPMGKRANDGPLSASKNRLWSALKSAKNIFASSATTSAAAKLEAHNTSPAAMRSPRRDSGESKMLNMPGALYSQKDVLRSPARNASVISFSPSRKTRSSTESDKRKEKELKAQQKAEEELERAREKERQKAAKQLAEEKAKTDKVERAEAAKTEKERKQAEKRQAANVERPGTADSEKASDADMPPPPPPKSGLLSTGKLKAPGRLMRPGREAAQTKPAPALIRIASQSQRAGQPASSTSSFSKSHGTGSAPQPPPKDGGARPSSAMGNRPGSAAPQNARVKALGAAARKKEADERAAQKKLEQKREIERKRAEKAEQERVAEEDRRAAEQQRVQEAKLAAQRKAAEKQAAEARKREQERIEQQRHEQERVDQQRREQDRIEQQRRELEQQRRDEEARKAREAHELADAIRRERAQQAQTHPRGDVPGTLRQLTKNIIPSNPAKSAKRQFPLEDDESLQQPQRPGIPRGPPSYQQTDSKRRKTNEEQDDGNGRRSVMAPPKRPSTLRKETLSKFSHGYTHAPPPAAHHASMFKATVTSQHQMQHGSKIHPSQLVQTSSARIPFAESSNPPATYQSSHQQTYSGYDNAPPNKFKTPARPAYAPKSAKSTPHYPQGDNIELPDIATDSEDESDEDEGGGFRAPSWVASPALRDLLTQQQLVDPESVFGPIGELKMDEVFKNSKNQERLKRFRDRGSSALWVETGDAVTSAEKRKDMELRERVAREGGWRFEPNV